MVETDQKCKKILLCFGPEKGQEFVNIFKQESTEKQRSENLVPAPTCSFLWMYTPIPAPNIEMRKGTRHPQCISWCSLRTAVKSVVTRDPRIIPGIMLATAQLPYKPRCFGGACSTRNTAVELNPPPTAKPWTDRCVKDFQNLSGCA